MSRPKTLNPKHCHHKATDRGFVVLNGVWKYTGSVGSWGTQAARDEYDRLIGEWIAGGRSGAAVLAGGEGGTSVNEVLSAFWIHATEFYRRADGTQTNEVENFRSALRPLRRLYGPTPADAFGPRALRAIQVEMIRLGWARSFINKQVARLKHVFKWAVCRELVPPSVHQALITVPGLKRGKTDARESEPVRPVSDADVDAIAAHVSPQVWAMVRLQRITGMRPGEVVIMRASDVDRSQPVWTYTPASHKTEHHGHARTVYLGPKAQEILLERWIDRPDLGAYLFQPVEAEAGRLAANHAARRTPAAHGNRPGTNRRRRPKVAPGDHYSVDAYRRAITRGCEAAFGMPGELRETAAGESPEQAKSRRAAAAAWRRANCWHPHQLRHTAGTNIRRDFGLEAAQVILGHTTLTATQVYAERNVGAARRIMGEVG